MIHIIDYKGFDIGFDEVTEKFSASDSRYDVEFVKSSIKALKKSINDFIKENANFGEFKIQEKSVDYSGKFPQAFPVIGITANKRLQYSDSKGKLSSLGKYDMDNFIIYKEENQPIFEAQVKLRQELKEIEREYNQKIRDLGQNLKITTMGEFILASGMDVEIR